MLAPPSLRQRSRELLVGRDFLRFVTARPTSPPTGAGRPVMLISGFGATDASLGLLRRFLQRLGHDARSAGLGRVTDDVEQLFPDIGRRCADLADETGRPVAVVGWSIGGVLAREAARDRPDVIDRVTTFGTPVEGGPSYTALAWRYTDRQLADIRQRVEERNRIPIEVPVTAIWSRNDGVVSPTACIDQRTPGVEHVEVTSTHLGMGIDPDVWSVVADRLARVERSSSNDRRCEAGTRR